MISFVFWYHPPTMVNGSENGYRAELMANQIERNRKGSLDLLYQRESLRNCGLMSHSNPFPSRRSVRSSIQTRLRTPPRPFNDNQRCWLVNKSHLFHSFIFAFSVGLSLWEYLLRISWSAELKNGIPFINVEHGEEESERRSEIVKYFGFIQSPAPSTDNNNDNQ